MRRRIGLFGPVCASVAAVALLTNNAAADNILVWDGGQNHPGITSVVSKLQALGHTVTRSSTVPANISGFDNLWAMDFFNGPNAADEQAMVTAFINSDRGVFAQYEWDCCKTSQQSWTATLSPLLKSSFLINGSQGVQQDAVADPGEVFGLSTTPNALPNLQINATANIATIPSANVVYRLNGVPVVGAYVDPQFVSGKGCVVLSGDIEQTFAAPQAEQWIQNVQYFLQNCAPNPQPVCGDGFLAQNEACDDGNTANGDGCSSTCQVEGGYTCTNDTGNTPVSSCVMACSPSPEVCDGADNDCDGQVDEGFNLGASCSAGVGACAAAGTIVCGEGVAVCNAVPGAPGAEVCDAVDNDCDGQVDEGFNLGASCSAGVGACLAPGFFVCGESGAAVCNAIPGAPSAEVCDAVDNDCDGDIDEGFNLGMMCSAGTGACYATGTIVCGPFGMTECTAVAGQPTVEKCDDVDNDCDGNTDEDFNLGAVCTVGVGACSSLGVLTCAESGLSECDATPGLPSVETCDAVDNDCDGSVDEDFKLGEKCSAGLGVCAASGFFVCGNDGGARCEAPLGTPSPEVCDGLDNDCDGTVDQDDPGGGDACLTNLPGVCSAGTTRCTAGVVLCEASISPGGGQELCDGDDNDCDGEVDEDFSLGSPCTIGEGACRASGIMVCASDGTSACNATPGAPAEEICDNIDNNCDGATDEGNPGGGAKCNTGLFGACKVGVSACGGEGIECVTIKAPGEQAESCGDTSDDDCDGLPSNGCPNDIDGDGLPDDQEALLGSKPNDADSDDDGVADGLEMIPGADSDADGVPNVLDADSDNDGLFDGTEMGFTCSAPGTNISRGRCKPDVDFGETVTNPIAKDTDGGGVSDGSEDFDLNGGIGNDEQNPTMGFGADDAASDADGDGLSDALEEVLGSSASDADSDDDGVPDGAEANPAEDTDMDGLVNVLDPDSDDDGLFDGTEMGFGCEGAGTDFEKGHCLADTDFGQTRTSALLSDTDFGGQKDGFEDANHNGVKEPLETDPNVAADDDDNDKDLDGLPDTVELAFGTNPLDADSDDDGVRDGDELAAGADTDGDGHINALDGDSDEDGLFDGTEMGFDCSLAGTDLSAGRCVADADQGQTITSPVLADTDGGGKADGLEDENKNGVVDGLETDPTVDHGDDDQNIDKDADGLSDELELALGSDPFDADSDDDGALDGQELMPGYDADMDGLANVLDPDSDNDGLFDGTEMGLGCGSPDTDPATKQCIPDADAGKSVTNPIAADTDEDGIPDGEEDDNKNGQVDSGETDPTFPNKAVPLVGCFEDADCGGALSGKVCDLDSHECVKGCSSEGNGCPAGMECDEEQGDFGACVESGTVSLNVPDLRTPEVGEDPNNQTVVSGNGLLCSAAPIETGSKPWAALVAMFGAVVAMVRRGRKNQKG